MQVVSGTAFPQNGSVSSSKGTPARSLKTSGDNGFSQIFDTLTRIEDEGGNVSDEAARHPVDGTATQHVDEDVSDDKADGAVVDELVDELSDEEEEESVSAGAITGLLSAPLPVESVEEARVDELPPEEIAPPERKADAAFKRSSVHSDDGPDVAVRPGGKDAGVPSVMMETIVPETKVKGVQSPSPETNPVTNRLFAKTASPGEISTDDGPLFASVSSDPEQVDIAHPIRQGRQLRMARGEGLPGRTDGAEGSRGVVEEESVLPILTAEGSDEMPSVETDGDNSGRPAMAMTSLTEVDPKEGASGARSDERVARPVFSGEGTIPEQRAAVGNERAGEQPAFADEGTDDFSQEDELAQPMLGNSRPASGRDTTDTRGRPVRGRVEGGSAARKLAVDEEVETSIGRFRGGPGTGTPADAGMETDAIEKPGVGPSSTNNLQEQDSFTNTGAKDSVPPPAAAPVPERAPTLSTTERTDFTTRLAQQLEDMVDTIVRERGPGGSEQVAITLHPEHLGRLLLRVRVDDTGVVHARFIADNAVVRSMIEQDLGQLRIALSEHGLSLGDAGVEAEVGSHGHDQAGLFAQSDSDPSFAHRPNEDPNGLSGDGNAAMGTADEGIQVSDEERQPSVSTGIDIRV